MKKTLVILLLLLVVGCGSDAQKALKENTAAQNANTEAINLQDLTNESSGDNEKTLPETDHPAETKSDPIDYGHALARLMDTAEVNRDDNGDIWGMGFWMNGKIRDADLVHFKRLPKLKTLGFEKTKVTDAGLVHLMKMTNLRVLYLQDTQVTDAGLVGLNASSNLEVLDLQGTQITDAGLVHLKGMTKLQWLGLRGTQVTDVGLLHLKEMPGLKRLWFSTTHVSRAAVAKLNQALPNCQIFHSNGLSP